MNTTHNSDGRAQVRFPEAGSKAARRLPISLATRPARWAKKARSTVLATAALGATLGGAVIGTGATAAAAAPAALDTVNQAAPAALDTVNQAAPVASSVHGAALSNYPIVGLASTPDSAGYWLVASNGGVFSFGDAAFHGSTGNVALAKPVVGIARTPDGGGYWLVASDGGIFSFGDAAFHGSTGNVRLNQPIVGMASTPDGKGYWLVARDGGIFTFGDAHFYGSTGNVALHKPIVGMTPTSDGRGYYLVASDGGIFTFGDAAFHGSTGNVNLAKPVIGMASTSDGQGYWLVASDGGVFTFGDAGFHGSAVSFNNADGGVTVGIVPVQNGYWVPNNLGGVASFSAPTPTAPPGPVVSNPVSSSVLPAAQNPSVSVAPSLAQAQACWGPVPNISACNSAALADINSARAGEGLGPLQLPSNFYSLSNVSQVLAVANAERTSRGLPALPENGSLDSMAQAGAVAGQDPTGPGNYSWGSNIAWGDATALAADFGWMYDDGPNSPNIDCTAANPGGCWGHRENILSPWGGQSGAGDFVNNGVIQLTELFVQNY